MQRNEIEGVGVDHVSWDEDFFEKAFVQVCQCIQTVSVYRVFKEKVRMWIRNVISVLNSNMDIYQYIWRVISPSVCLSYIHTDDPEEEPEV